MKKRKKLPKIPLLIFLILNTSCVLENPKTEAISEEINFLRDRIENYQLKNEILNNKILILNNKVDSLNQKIKEFSSLNIKNQINLNNNIDVKSTKK
jgi:GTPase involved in cell partitioning and DNA repair